MAEILYKYRSLKNFKRFTDILFNKRLYCALFTELNDPMEGFFWHSTALSQRKLKKIMKEKFSYKICSLSQSWQDIGLWTFYADEGRGCCIAVEPTDDSWEKKVLRYDNNLPNFDELSRLYGDVEAIERILNTKLDRWSNESEIRFIKQTKDKYIPIRIKEIILGYKIDKEDEKIIRQMIEMLNSFAKDKNDIIEVRKMSKRSLEII